MLLRVLLLAGVCAVTGTSAASTHALSKGTYTLHADPDLFTLAEELRDRHGHTRFRLQPLHFFSSTRTLFLGTDQPSGWTVRHDIMAWPTLVNTHTNTTVRLVRESGAPGYHERWMVNEEEAYRFRWRLGNTTYVWQERDTDTDDLRMVLLEVHPDAQPRRPRRLAMLIRRRSRAQQPRRVQLRVYAPLARATEQHGELACVVVATAMKLDEEIAEKPEERSLEVSRMPEASQAETTPATARNVS